MPSITGINPASIYAGDPEFTLTVNGNNFVNGKSTVWFNGKSMTTTFIDENQLVASVLTNDILSAGNYKVTVFNTSGGGFSNELMLKVNPVPTKISVETAADGSGTVVPTQSLTTGSPLAVYAIARDASNNFVTNVAADVWNLQNIVGGIIPDNLVPAADGKSAVFMSHIAGSATIIATSGILSSTGSGTLTVYSATGIDEGNKSLAYALMQNYPNPFNHNTTISYQVPTRSHVVIKVYDINGVEVATLVNRTVGAGQETITFDAGSLSGGTYFYRLQAGQYFESRKFQLLK